MAISLSNPLQGIVHVVEIPRNVTTFFRGKLTT
jgi:hypothetical protein